jgi:hypothetical protein
LKNNYVLGCSYVLLEKGKMLKNKRRHLLQAVIQISTCFFFPWLPVFPSKMYLSIIHHPRWIGQWADKGKKDPAVLLYCQ